jgi:hypothetical protein
MSYPRLRHFLVPGRRLLSAAIASLLLATQFSTAATPTANLIPALGWDIRKQGAFPTSIASDHSGNIWVGTEDNGLWKYDAADKSWAQFTTRDGLGDNCIYALAVDNLGRVWAGHLNHGVSVYNGAKWRNYGLIDGPLGDRVFCIAISPKDNDVWIATDMGLARYSESRHDWDYYTRASGIPSDQIQGIDIDPSGKVAFATQADGVAIGTARDNYEKWQTSPPVSMDNQGPEGLGFISDLSNAIYLFTSPGGESLTGVLTPLGFDASPDGTEWHFVRSARPGAPPVNNILTLGDAGVQLPLEDWMTTLGSDGKSIWIGYRKAGVEKRDFQKPETPELTANISGSNPAIIRSILALPDEPPLIAAYDAQGGGLLTVDNAPGFKATRDGDEAKKRIPDLPSPVPAPAVDDSTELGSRLEKLTLQIAAGEAYYLADDWRTEGDWIGRYGSAYVSLCGMGDNGDRTYLLQPGYEVSYQSGNFNKISSIAPVSLRASGTSTDLRDLYDPTAGIRHDVERTNTANADPNKDQPEMWIRIKVPDGIQCLSFYFLNNLAHTSAVDKFDDYDLQILANDPNPGKIPFNAPLARARVSDFWGGVYKQFLICGPATYFVRIHPNQCSTVNLSGLFIDHLTGDMPDNPGQLPGFDKVQYVMPNEPDNINAGPLGEAAIDLWNQLDGAFTLRGAVALQMPFRIWSYRAAVASNVPAALLERWRWDIGIWTPDDRRKFDDAVKAAHDAINH